ncbi:hypothetical protein P8452_55981 [Trifolium repens]|jgi:hypothetical protein|nr:hypothetical protein P8452_55981 [Trifolium repens]
MAEQNIRRHNNEPKQDRSRRNSVGNQAIATKTTTPFEKYFNFAGVVKIDGEEEYSNPNGVKRWHEGGPCRTITILVYIVKDFKKEELRWRKEEEKF